MSAPDRPPPAAADLALIGMALALPDAPTAADLHANLAAGRDSVRPIPPERFRLLGLAPGGAHLPAATLPSIDRFDHEFFRLSPREARSMDPHHRLLLQLAWQAVEDAGYAVARLGRTRVGVYVTSHHAGYLRLLAQRDTVAMLGNAPAALAGRVSYLLGFEGPSLVVDTGCSSGLVALQLAAAALREGACDAALVGGVSLRTSLDANLAVGGYPELISTSGRCRAFDAAADGTSDGEGGVVLLLKLRERAEADGDHLRAVIRSVAVGHNGNRSNGFSAPSPAAQVELLTQAWRAAGVRREDFLFLEAHGSGTQLGDAIELTAVQSAWRALPGPDDAWCAIGSVKTNLGHLDQVAGLAGLAKAVVGLEHGYRYPSLHFHSPNPAVRWDGSVRVAREGAAVRVGSGSVVGVSSFSLTGTNVHVVVGRAAVRRPAPAAPPADLVTVSGRSGAALRRCAQALWRHLHARPELPWWQAAYVLNAGRDDLPYRLAFVATDRQTLLDGLYECQLRAVPDRPAGGELALALGPGDLPAPLAEVLGRFPAYRTAAAAAADPDQPAARRGGLRALLSALGVDPVEVGADGPPGRPPGEAAPVLSVRGPAGAERVLVPAGPVPATAFHAALAALYEQGFDLDWDAYYADREVSRVPLPSYPFEPVRCWPDRLPTGPDRGVRAAGSGAAGSGVAGSGAAGRMAELWRTVLGIREPTGHTHYFQVGGNSVLALELLARAEREFGVRLRLADLYEHPTLGELSALLAGRRPGTDATVIRRRSTGRSAYRPSFGQESLWILDRIWPDLGMYNIPVDIPLHGELDLPALTAAFAGLARRHEVLRSRMVTRDGRPLVVVDDEPTPDFTYVDLRRPDRTAEQCWQAAYQRAGAEGARPFRLDRDHPMRVRLYQTGERDHLLLFVTHHSADDGWTPDLLRRELAELYAAHRAGRPPQLPEPPIQYGDYAAWQRGYWVGERLTAELDFWRDRLAGAAPSQLPTDHPRPAQPSGRGAHHRFTIDRELAGAARRLGHAYGVSLFVVLMSAFKATLARWGGQRDITVGITTAGRDQTEVRDLFGYFNNAVALRTDLGGDPSFEQLLERERRVVATALEHDRVPFAEVVAAVTAGRDASRHPVFQVGMTHQHLPPAEDLFLPGVRVDRQRVPRLAGLAAGTAKWDLDFGVWDRDDDAALPAVLEYSTDLFEPATVAELAESLTQVLREVTGQPELRLSRIPLASPRQRRQELARSAGPRPPVGAGHDPVALLDAAAAREPDRVFVRDRAGELTYRQVREGSRELAARLRGGGHTPVRGRVASLLARGTDTVVAVFAAWRAGSAWLPLDPDLPAERIGFLLADADPDAVVSDPDTVARFRPALGDRPVHRPASGRPPAPVGAGAAEPVGAAGGAAGYVIYTSGSTGRPKGVLIPRSALRYYCAHWAGQLPAGCSLLTTASSGFDVFIGDVLRALAAGGTITVAGVREAARPEALAGLLDRHAVTVMEIAPAAARRGLVRHLSGSGRRTGLRLLINGSETWTGAEQAATTGILAPSGRVLNLYGVTECTIDSLTFFDDGSIPDQDEVPVGTPVAHTIGYLLDPDTGEPVPPGAVGEICLAGPGLADGYLGRPALTADRFRPDPHATAPGTRLYRTGDLGRRDPAGRLRFLGRLDRQLSVNGVRIEPGEVESALRRDPAVTDALVSVVDRPEGGQALAALLEVGGGGTAGLADQVRRRLATRVPAQLVPAVIVPVPRLPRLPNAKPDLAAAAELLRAPPVVTAARRDAPQDRIELRLATMLGELLDRPVGVADNFFEAGGTSLLAIRFLAEIGERFGVELPVTTLFHAPTVAGLAEAVRERERERPAGRAELVVALRAAPAADPALFLVHASGGDVLSYYRFAQELPVRLRVYGVRSCQPAEAGAAVLSLPEMAAVHLPEIRRRLPAGQPLLVAGWSFGGALAYELARQWYAAGSELGFLGLIEAMAEPPAHSYPEEEADILVSLLRLNSGLVVDPAALRARDRPERFEWVAERAREAGVVSRHTSDEDLRRLLRVNLRHDTALAGYRPEPFPGHGHVFRATGPDGPDRPADLGWGKLLDSVTSVDVPGGHYDLFSAHSTELAGIVGRALGATEGTGESHARR
jgi:amino acid adenylation domain-containing protein